MPDEISKMSGEMAEESAKKAGIDESVADAIGDAAESVVATGKKWFKSKTVWTNIIALIAIVAQVYYSFIVPVEWQAGLLALVNVVLRKYTKESLV